MLKQPHWNNIETNHNDKNVLTSMKMSWTSVHSELFAKVIVGRRKCGGNPRLSPSLCDNFDVFSPSVVLPFWDSEKKYVPGWFGWAPTATSAIAASYAADAHVYIDNRRYVYRLLQTCVSPKMADAPRKQRVRVTSWARSLAIAQSLRAFVACSERLVGL